MENIWDGPIKPAPVRFLFESAVPHRAKVRFSFPSSYVCVFVSRAIASLLDGSRRCAQFFGPCVDRWVRRLKQEGFTLSLLLAVTCCL